MTKYFPQKPTASIGIICRRSVKDGMRVPFKLSVFDKAYAPSLILLFILPHLKSEAGPIHIA